MKSKLKRKAVFCVCEYLKVLENAQFVFCDSRNKCMGIFLRHFRERHKAFSVIKKLACCVQRRFVILYLPTTHFPRMRTSKSKKFSVSSSGAPGRQPVVRGLRARGVHRGDRPGRRPPLPPGLLRLLRLRQEPGRAGRIQLGRPEERLLQAGLQPEVRPPVQRVRPADRPEPGGEDGQQTQGLRQGLAPGVLQVRGESYDEKKQT